MQLAQLTSYTEIQGIALALALGLLVGIQRDWTLRDAPAGSRFAGMRTFGLIGLSGGIAGALISRAPALSIILLGATAALVLIGYWRATERGGAISGTASLVGLLTMACGFMAAGGDAVLASVASGVMVLLLSLRRQLHRWIDRLKEVEVKAIARFALIALVILPLLPDTPFGPFGAWRPRQLWLVVVLVSGFSFLGYLAAKWLGPSRGTLATAAAGAMVSSTAVTAALAARLRDEDGDPALLAAAVALASAVMFARVMMLTFALAGFALPTLAMLASPALLISLIATAVLLRRRHTANPAAAALPVRNPFDLGPALLLMVMVMILSVAARWVLDRYGDTGLATVLALSGVADVDSAIITLGNLPPGTIGPRLAGLVLLPPILLNTLFKAAVTIGVAGWHKGWPSAAALVASVIGALAALPLVL